MAHVAEELTSMFDERLIDCIYHKTKIVIQPTKLEEEVPHFHAKLWMRIHLDCRTELSRSPQVCNFSIFGLNPQSI